MCCWGWEERGQQIGQRAAILLRGLGGGAEASWRTPSLLFTGRVEEMYEAKMEIYPGTWKVALLDLKYSFWIKIAMGLGIWPTDQNTPCGPTQEFWPASQSMLSIHKCHARYQWWLKDLGSLCTRPGLSSWHLASDWPSLSCCRHLEGEPVDGKSACLSLCILPTKQNKLTEGQRTGNSAAPLFGTWLLCVARGFREHAYMGGLGCDARFHAASLHLTWPRSPQAPRGPVWRSTGTALWGV